MPATHPNSGQKSRACLCGWGMTQASTSGNREVNLNGDHQHDAAQASGDIELTINFPGCPSSSTCITYPGSQEPRCEEISEASETNRGSSCNMVGMDAAPPKAPNFEEKPWPQTQGRNNNRCADDSSGGRNSEEANQRDENLNNHEDESSRNDGVDSEDDDEEKNGFNDKTQGSDIGAQGNCDRGVLSEKGNLQDELCGTSLSPLRKKKSTGSLAACGRAVLSRVNRSERSPQRITSPTRKKASTSKGCSAPIPTPVQNSSGFTNIRRQSSASPTRQNAPRSLGKVFDNVRSAPAKQNVFGRQMDPAEYDSEQSGIMGNTSPSRGIPSTRRPKAIEPPPIESLADSDLRRQSSGTTIDAKTVPCQIIIPEDSVWSPRAPYGDIKQMSPQKILEMSRVASNDERRQTTKHQDDSCQRKKILKSNKYTQGSADSTPTAYLSESLMSFEGSQANITDSSVTTEDKLGIKDGAAAAFDNARGTSVNSTSTVGKQRLSRRHPVLDKMFRHVLASLVQESGPPNSARLASVVGHVSGQDGSAGTSQSEQPSGVSSSSHSESTTLPTASNYSSSIYGGSRSSYVSDRLLLFGRAKSCRSETSHSGIGGGLGHRPTHPAPCTLANIDEKVKVGCPRSQGHGQAVAAITDI